MKLRALHLTNMRKFAGKTASIIGIGDGITVVSEANEFGKSTFFDALHALFFTPFGSGKDEVKRLQPRPSGGPVTVAVEVETATGLFRIEKRFLSKKRAMVMDTSDGTLIAQDDEAEAWIDALIDQGLRGPAGLLWVRQGMNALEPSGNVGADKSEKECLLGARRDLLSSVAGEIDLMTGGRRMDRVLERCKTALEELATPTGQPRAGKPWREAREDAERLRTAVTEMEVRCRELSTALEERRTREAELARWQDTTAQEARRADLSEARSAHQAAEAHAERCAAANRILQVAELQLSAAEARLQNLLRSEQRLDRVHKELVAARHREVETGKILETAQAEERNAMAVLNAASAEVMRLRAVRDRALRVRHAQAARDKGAELRSRHAAAQNHRQELEEADAGLKANLATETALAVLDAAQNDVQAARLLRDAQAVTVAVGYTAAVRVTLDGQALRPGVPVAVQGVAELALPGIGHLTIDAGTRAGNEVIENDLRRAEAALDTALLACGADTVEAARDAARRRRDMAMSADLARGMLASLVPEGIEALHAACLAADAQAQGVEEGESDLPEPEALEVQLAEAERAEVDARCMLESVRKRCNSAAEAVASCRTARALAEDALAVAEVDAGSEDLRAGHRQAARDAVASNKSQVDVAQAAFDTLNATAPDFQTATAVLARAQGAVEQADKAISELKLRLTELSATIRTRAEDGIEEALEETRGRLDAAIAREGRFATEVAALVRLREVLDATRSHARDAYFGPVQEELRPLLSILHDDAELRFDTERMLPEVLLRNGRAEDMAVLSGGTQEQIAILTRLAFARLFVRNGRPVPIILDDALVHTDDDRIVRMFTALHRVAADQQIIVFTCRQMAFAALGGDRPVVEVTAAA